MDWQPAGCCGFVFEKHTTRHGWKMQNLGLTRESMATLATIMCPNSTHIDGFFFALATISPRSIIKTVIQIWWEEL
jgi:hypothetical protein